MLPGKEHWIPIAEAAKLANTDISYLHKLAKREIRADYIQKGKTKKWFIDPDCHRWQKLLYRNNPEQLSQVFSRDPQAQHYIDWLLWEDMCRRGEQIAKRPCSKNTLKEYKRYLTGFFRDYGALTRDTLRAALKKYEDRSTIERDFYSSRFWLFRAAITMAKFFVYKGYETPEFIDNLRYLKPRKGHTVVSRPCHTEATIQNAMEMAFKAKNKKGIKVYNEYSETLNRTLIALAWFTGARSEEMCNIRIKDVYWKKDCIRLFGKGGKERFVGICDELRQALKSYWMIRPETNSEYFLVHHKGGQLTPNYIGGRMRRLRKYMGVKDFTAHSIRRGSITWMLNQQKLPLPIVRDAVGHSSLAVTNIYAQPTANDVIQAMKDL